MSILLVKPQNKSRVKYFKLTSILTRVQKPKITFNFVYVLLQAYCDDGLKSFLIEQSISHASLFMFSRYF